MVKHTGLFWRRAAQVASERRANVGGSVVSGNTHFQFSFFLFTTFAGPRVLIWIIHGRGSYEACRYSGMTSISCFLSRLQPCPNKSSLLSVVSADRKRCRRVSRSPTALEPYLMRIGQVPMQTDKSLAKQKPVATRVRVLARSPGRSTSAAPQWQSPS